MYAINLLNCARFDSICRADKIYSGGYSFGESIISLRHNRERESAMLRITVWVDTYSRQWMALTNLLLSSVSHLTSPNYVGQ